MADLDLGNIVLRILSEDESDGRNESEKNLDTHPVQPDDDSGDLGFGKEKYGLPDEVYSLGYAIYGDDRTNTISWTDSGNKVHGVKLSKEQYANVVNDFIQISYNTGKRILKVPDALANNGSEKPRDVNAGTVAKDDSVAKAPDMSLVNINDVTGADGKTHKVLTAVDEKIKNETVFYTIPDGVEEIGPNAFSGCKLLRSVIVPDSVVKICRGAFRDCRNMWYIVFGISVSDIDDEAFAGCSRLGGTYSIALPPSVKRIGKYAFFDCKVLKDFSVKDGGQNLVLGYGSLGNTNISKIILPRNVSIEPFGSNEVVPCKEINDSYNAVSIKEVFGVDR